MATLTTLMRAGSVPNILARSAPKAPNPTLAPSIPSTQWRPVTPSRTLSGTVGRAILSNVRAETFQPSAPTVNTGPSVGPAGSADNAGNIAGAGSTPFLPSTISLPFVGAVNPLWLAAGAAVVLFLVLKD